MLVSVVSAAGLNDLEGTQTSAVTGSGWAWSSVVCLAPLYYYYCHYVNMFLLRVEQ